MSNTTRPARYWVGEPPAMCDICLGKIEREFIDGKTWRGAWGTMHQLCHQVFGQGIGVGRGQRYAQQDDGRWLCIDC